MIRKKIYYFFAIAPILSIVYIGYSRISDFLIEHRNSTHFEYYAKETNNLIVQEISLLLVLIFTLIVFEIIKKGETSRVKIAIKTIIPTPIIVIFLSFFVLEFYGTIAIGTCVLIWITLLVIITPLEIKSPNNPY